jgi:hypothetical protein
MAPLPMSLARPCIKRTVRVRNQMRLNRGDSQGTNFAHEAQYGTFPAAFVQYPNTLAGNQHIDLLKKYQNKLCLVCTSKLRGVCLCKAGRLIDAFVCTCTYLQAYHVSFGMLVFVAICICICFLCVFSFNARVHVSPRLCALAPPGWVSYSPQDCIS